MISPSDLSNAISAFVARRGLTLRTGLDDTGWTFWELRTLNRHRAVGFLGDCRKPADVQQLGSDIRGLVSRNFKRAWWRGFAYGIVAEVQTIACKPADLEGLVDIYENRNGVLQWVILVGVNDGAVVGVHTWMETFLSPVYREILQTLAAAGYRVSTAVKGKDGLLKFLTGVAGLQGVAFPEFHGNDPGA